MALVVRIKREKNEESVSFTFYTIRSEGQLTIMPRTLDLTVFVALTTNPLHMRAWGNYCQFGGAV